MIRSLKGKLLALLVAIFAATAVCVIFIGMQEVRSVSKRAESRSLENVLQFARSSVESAYHTLTAQRAASVDIRKQRLTESAALAVDGLQEFAALAERGVLQPEEAQQQALQWVEGLRLGDKAYFLVYDDALQPLASNVGPDAGGLANAQDSSGSPLLAGMRTQVQNQNGAFAEFETQHSDSGNPTRMLGYFTQVPAFNWVVSTGMDITDLGQDEANRLSALDTLAQSLSEARIADSGFAFVFNGAGKLLIGPPERPASIDNAVNDIASAESIASIISAADDGANSVVLQIEDDQGMPHTVNVRVYHHAPLDWYVAAASFQDEVTAPVLDLAMRQGAVIGAFFLLAFILMSLVANRIATPLKRLAGLAVQIGSEDVTATETPVSKELRKLSKERKDEVGLVALALRTMDDKLRENVSALLQSIKERERTDYELDLARSIQKDMLQEGLESHMEEDDADLHALLLPARNVGGDLFYYERIGPNRILFAVGDVSEKGVSAALFMALTMSILKSKTRQVADPGRMLLEINDELYRGNASQMFVTLFVGVLNTEDGDLRYASGGHNPALVINPDGAARYLDVTEDPMLGILPDASFSTHIHTIAPGETVVAYSNGVTEAMNPSRSLFGGRRLEVVASKYVERSPKMLGKIIAKAVDIYENDAEQSDDIALIVLRRKDMATERAVPAASVVSTEEWETVTPAPVPNESGNEAPLLTEEPETPAYEVESEDTVAFEESEAEADTFDILDSQEDAAGYTAQGAALDAFLAQGDKSHGAEALETEVPENDELYLSEQNFELSFDEKMLENDGSEHSSGYTTEDVAAEVMDALSGESLGEDGEEPLDLAPEWVLGPLETDDITSALYLGDELEDLEADEDMPLDLPESVFSADAALAEQALDDTIPEPPNLDDFRLTTDPEELLETDDDMALLSLGLDENELLDDELPPPTPTAPDGYTNEPLLEGGFEVIPSPPGDLYAQNPDLQDRTLEPYDDPGSFISIHSDVKMHPQYPDADIEFALDETDESGYFELELGEDEYGDLYLDENAIGGIDTEEGRKA